MAKYISNRLARLIRRRSYLAGEIGSAQRLVNETRLRLSQANGRLTSLKVKLTKLDEAIAKEAPEIDPEDILVRKQIERHIVCRHGGLVGEVVQILQASPDTAVSLGSIVDHVAPKVGLPTTTRREIRYAFERLRRVLNDLKYRGAVVRLPTPEGSRQGIWIWRGL